MLYTLKIIFMSLDRAPSAAEKPLAEQIQDIDAQIEEAHLTFNTDLVKQLQAEKQTLEDRLAISQQAAESAPESVTNIIANGDPVELQKLDEKYRVTPPSGGPVPQQERDEWGNLPEPVELQGMREALHEAHTRLMSLPDGEEREALQQQIYEMTNKIKEVAEKPQMDEFVKKAEEFRGNIKDTSFDGLKNSLKGFKLRGSFDDGRGHDGQSAAGYAMAIMGSDMTDAQKLELLSDVSGGMSGFSGDFASKIVGGYKKDLEGKMAGPEAVADLLSLGSDAAYSGKINQDLLKKIKSLLDKGNQDEIAEAYFAKTIGESISNNKSAYPVYLALKGTPFAKKFAELEDARLKTAGYAGFSL